MKRILFLICLFTSSSVLYAENVKQQENTKNQAEQMANSNKVKVSIRPEIVGLWGMEIPQNKKCVEYYNFKSNNNVVINSGSEWSSGIYEYQPIADPNTPLSALTLQVQYDNNDVDCSGIKEDQSGEVSQYYVKWKDADTLNLCNPEKSEQCFATLQRVLP